MSLKYKVVAAQCKAEIEIKVWLSYGASVAQ